MKPEKLCIHVPAETFKALRSIVVLLLVPIAVTAAPQSPLISLVYLVASAGLWLAIRHFLREEEVCGKN